MERERQRGSVIEHPFSEVEEKTDMHRGVRHHHIIHFADHLFTITIADDDPLPEKEISNIETYKVGDVVAADASNDSYYVHTHGPSECEIWGITVVERNQPE